MQREHVIYALTGMAIKLVEHGDYMGAQSLISLSSNPVFTVPFAELLDEANEDELVNQLISMRVVEEQKRKKGLIK